MTPSPEQRLHQVRRAWELEVLSRLRLAAGDRNFRALADLTDCHPETVRRYMRKGRASAYYMARLCLALDISLEWLLHGDGPMSRTERRGTLESKPRGRVFVNGAGSKPVSRAANDPFAAI